MQSKQNIWNLVVFLLLSAVVLYGWNYLQNKLWPPPPRKSPPVALHLDSRQWTDLVGLASGTTLAPTVPGVGYLGQLSADVVVALEQPKAELARTPESKPQPRKEPPKVAPLPTAKHEAITLGGESFNLRVELTTQYASVKSVILTQF